MKRNGEVDEEFSVPAAERVEPGGEQAIHLAGGRETSTRWLMSFLRQGCCNLRFLENAFTRSHF